MQGHKKALFQVEGRVRKTLIAGLMAAGLLTGCGSTTGDETGGTTTVCADGSACTGSAEECAKKCDLADGTRHAQWFTMLCCDGTECRTPGAPSICKDYCDTYHDGSYCY